MNVVQSGETPRPFRPGKKLGAALLSLSLVASGVTQDTALQSLSTRAVAQPIPTDADAQFDPQHYATGAAGPERTTLITSPIGKLALKGDTLKITPGQVRMFQKAHPQVKAISVIYRYNDVQYGPETARQAIWTSVPDYVPPKNIPGAVDYIIPSIHNPRGKKSLSLSADLPSQSLWFSFMDARKVLRSERTVLTRTPEARCKDGSRIIAPYALKKSFVSDICAVDAQYAPFMKGAILPHYHVHTRADYVAQGNSYEWTSGVIEYNSLQLRDKKGYDLSRMVLAHEQAHGVFHLSLAASARRKLVDA